MKTRCTLSTLALVFASIVFAGCGSKEKERAEKERARIELEKKAEREAETGNKAITDINRRLFGKKPTPTPKDDSPSAERKESPSQPATPPAKP